METANTISTSVYTVFWRSDKDIVHICELFTYNISQKAYA